MSARNSIVVTFVAVGTLIPGISLAAVEILKEEPPKGSIPYRKVVYVDDGTCPTGEVKEITGGDQRKAIPREVRCVKRPAG